MGGIIGRTVQPATKVYSVSLQGDFDDQVLQAKVSGGKKAR